MTVSTRPSALIAAAGSIGVCLALPMVARVCSSGPQRAGVAGGCATAAAWIPLEVFYGGLLVGGALALALIASILHQALVHHWLSRTLSRLSRPGILADQPVGLISSMGPPVVAGVRRPWIYCPDELATLLKSDEVRAVLLHERHHQLARAPATLVILAGLSPIIGRAGPGRAWLERERARIEIAADEYAVGSGAARSAIARALLKLQAVPMTAPIAAFATASELRLRALLGERPSPSRPRPVHAAIASAIVAGIVCLAPI